MAVYHTLRRPDVWRAQQETFHATLAIGDTRDKRRDAQQIFSAPWQAVTVDSARTSHDPISGASDNLPEA